MESMNDSRRLFNILKTKMLARGVSTISGLAMPSKKESEGWDHKLKPHVEMSLEYRAAQELIDRAPRNVLDENVTLWQATLLIFGESPYDSFSRTKGMMYLTGSQFKVGDTSPIFTHASVEHLLRIINHPFLVKRSTSKTLRLFLQFSVITRIGARTGWAPPLVDDESCCPILNSPVLKELRKEMSLVSKNDHPTESIYERFARLTKSHPKSVETLILAESGLSAHARASEHHQRIRRRQKELYDQEGICAVSIYELIAICQAIDDVASAKREMTTERALETFNKAKWYCLPVPSRKMPSLMKEAWQYQTYLLYKSQQSQVSAEETPQQCIGNNGTTPSPRSASGDLSEVHEPDERSTAVECRITREVIAVDTEDDMNCCAAIDDAPKKSLAELWMDEIHLNCQSERSKLRECNVMNFGGNFVCLMVNTGLLQST